MSKLEVFDPAMCCPTGVCGPAVDPALVRFAADLDWLRQKGVEVRRYNLAQEPAAFAANPLVRDKLAADSTACLPLLLVDGVEQSAARYPDRRELAAMAGVAFDPRRDAPAVPLPNLPLAGGNDQCC